MKLYTEEQVKDLLDKMEVIYSLKELTPIELPSDEELERHIVFIEWDDKLSFKKGALWMKEQIFNKK